ncbi:GNAT family N-acetyltransferase [Paenibacillus nanensis]|nr:GNAT family N-acetyltransferase [Paenibacillus nanensis]
MTLTLRGALESDLPILAQMNKQLIDDEGSLNPMTISELEDRMRVWLLSDWHIDLLCKDTEIVGYALYQFRDNTYYKVEREVYVRQFFITSDHRMMGFGREGINLLKETRFPDVKTIIVDVLVNNHRGMSFWQQVGFAPYQTTMKLHTK